MDVGQHGEDLAATHLQQLGYHLLGRNVRLHPGELDLVMQDGNELVIVEVKTRTGTQWPELAVTAAKQKTLFRTATRYMEAHNLVHLPARFDVVAIRLMQGLPPEIAHYRDAFRQTFEY